MSDRPITTEQAVLAAKAAGLDASPLEEQIRSQGDGGEADRLRARVAELEAQLAGEGDGTPGADRPGQAILDGINAARTPWVRFGQASEELEAGDGS